MGAAKRKPVFHPHKIAPSEKPSPAQEEPRDHMNEEQIRSILLSLYRSGTVPTIIHLNAEEKATLRALLDADTKAEIIFKHPEREKLRQQLREHLNYE